VARLSKKQSRRGTSAILFVLAASSMAVAVAKMRQHDVLTGFEFGGWAFLPLALLLGFALPVKCRVKTTRGTACGNTAYGLLFGCSNAAGHWLDKFRARLHLQSGTGNPVQPAQRTRPTANYAAMYHIAPGPEPLKVTIEDTTLSRCGVWAGIVSAAVGVAGVIITLMVH
jgi:hypothetical protein